MAACALALAVSIVKADSPAEVAAGWGLLGTWKVDCSTPTSRDNMAETYAVKDGALFEFRDLGELHDVNPVRAAHVDGEGRLVVAIEFPSVGGLIRENVMSKSADRKRTVENHRLDHAGVTVHDGRFTGSGEPTPWFQRCEGLKS